MTPQLKSHILDLHNSYRANVTPSAANMMKLVCSYYFHRHGMTGYMSLHLCSRSIHLFPQTWDDEVAMIAQKWADACHRNAIGKLHHDHTRLIPGKSLPRLLKTYWSQNHEVDLRGISQISYQTQRQAQRRATTGRSRHKGYEVI